MFCLCNNLHALAPPMAAAADADLTSCRLHQMSCVSKHFNQLLSHPAPDPPLWHRIIFKGPPCDETHVMQLIPWLLQRIKVTPFDEPHACQQRVLPVHTSAPAHRPTMLGKPQRSFMVPMTYCCQLQENAQLCWRSQIRQTLTGPS